MRLLALLIAIVVGCSSTEAPSGISPDASALVGPQGPIGPTGPQGPTGEAGLAGPTGLTGAAGLAGPTGPQGLPGSQGLQGLPGPTGPQGLAGLNGLPGPVGPAGLQGVQGSQGIQGPQGPAGTPCDTTRLSNLETEVAALQSQVPGLCPAGFAQVSDPNYTICQRTVSGLTDQMVKAGRFWIDRYEASVCSGVLGIRGANNTTAVACSVAGRQPQVLIEQFQAWIACDNAGKRLCSMAEHQTATAGMPWSQSWPGAYPLCGASPSTTKCNTCAGSNGNTGQAVECVSRFGAYDLVGNVWEWIVDWGQTAVGGGRSESWDTPTGAVGDWWRYDQPPSIEQSVGFRCCI